LWLIILKKIECTFSWYYGETNNVNIYLLYRTIQYATWQNVFGKIILSIHQSMHVFRMYMYPIFQYFNVLYILLILLVVILMTFILCFAARVISNINDCCLAYDNMLTARMFVEPMPFKLSVVRWLLLAISVQNVFSRPVQEYSNTRRRIRSTPIYDDVVRE